MTDVFVSYSRRDTEFVQRIAASIESRGKTVWIDTADIADAEVFPAALRTAIEGSDAFLFVISPTSVASQFCEQEVDYAHALEKRIVPVLRSTVADADVPEEIRQRNWIPFTETDDYDVSLERLVHAIDTDLQHCKEHTRWLVKALEWETEGRDRSFLLRGSELKAAESWLARIPVDADPAPTTLQNEYILASRRAAARRQRALLGVSVAVTAVAIGLGVLALVSRNQAVSSSNTARAQALAAEADNQLSADPEVSVLLARQAVQVAPIPQAVSALRQAMDTSAVRLALPTESVTDCKYQASSFLAYSPDGHRVAGGSCTGEVTVVATATGRIVYRRHLPVQEDDVAYDPDGHALAVGTSKGVYLLDPTTGSTVSHLAGRGQIGSLAFSLDGAELAATSNLGVTVWDMASGKAHVLIPDPFSHYSTVAFTSDGQDLVAGTDLGFTAVIDVVSGKLVRKLAPKGQAVSTGAGDWGPVALHGNLLVVGEGVTGPGDVSGDIDLWNTQTWTMTGVLTQVTGTAIGSVAVSPDQRAVAIGNYDGTGGVWSIDPHEELVPISGQTADLNTIVFSPSGADVAVVANDGTSRIYRAGGPWMATLPATLCGCGNEIGWQSDKMTALTRSGSDIVVRTWAMPSGRLVAGSRVINTDQVNEGVALSRDGTLAALWNDSATDSAVRVINTATGRLVYTLPPVPEAGVTFSDDDRLLAVADANGGLHIVTLSDGRTVMGHGWPNCDASNGINLVISANDRLVGHGTFCGQVAIGSTDTAKVSETFDQHQQLSDIAFNTAGTRLALASWDSTVTILDVATDKPAVELVGHARGVTGVATTPDDRYVVTTSVDGTTRVWSAATGQQLEIDHDESGTENPSISPDGRLVAESNSDNQVRLWALCTDCADPSALLAASRSFVVSPLTPIERDEVAAASG